MCNSMFQKSWHCSTNDFRERRAGSGRRQTMTTQPAITIQADSKYPHLLQPKKRSTQVHITHPGGEFIYSCLLREKFEQHLMHIRRARSTTQMIFNFLS